VPFPGAPAAFADVRYHASGNARIAVERVVEAPIPEDAVVRDAMSDFRA
jgi:hypothetical protein